MKSSRFSALSSTAELDSLCRRFNLTFTVGDYVILRKDSGEIETMLESPAWVLEGHSAVAKFRGVSGAYSIEDNRVRHLAPADLLKQVRDRLRGCPFCGEEAILEVLNIKRDGEVSHFSIGCSDMECVGASGPAAPPIEKLTQVEASWNSRVDC